MVWDNLVDKYIIILKKANIKKIVIASSQSGVLKTLYKFKEKECKIGELVNLTKKVAVRGIEMDDECYGFYINL